MHVIRWVKQLFEQPLMHVYLNGPQIAGYGCWESKNQADICAEMTGVSSDHWVGQVAACAELIERHFDIMMTLFYLILYLILLKVIITAVFRLCVFALDQCIVRSTGYTLLHDRQSMYQYQPERNIVIFNRGYKPVMHPD